MNSTPGPGESRTSPVWACVRASVRVRAGCVYECMLCHVAVAYAGQVPGGNTHRSDMRTSMSMVSPNSRTTERSFSVEMFPVVSSFPPRAMKASTADREAARFD